MLEFWTGFLVGAIAFVALFFAGAVWAGGAISRDDVLDREEDRR